MSSMPPLFGIALPTAQAPKSSRSSREMSLRFPSAGGDINIWSLYNLRMGRNQIKKVRARARERAAESWSAFMALAALRTCGSWNLRRPDAGGHFQIGWWVSKTYTRREAISNDSSSCSSGAKIPCLERAQAVKIHIIEVYHRRRLY